MAPIFTKTSAESSLKPIALIWFFAMLLVATGCWLTNQLINEDHTRTLANTEDDLVNLGRVSQEHAERTFYSVDQTLRLMRGQYIEHQSRLDMKALGNQGLIETRILLEVAVIDAQGILQSSNLPHSGRMNFSDHEYFKNHLNQTEDVLLISKSLLRHKSGQPSIQISRRITNARGEFTGVVVAWLDPRYFTHFYTELRLGQQAVGAIFGIDGSVLALRIGEKEKFSGDLSRSPALLQLIQNGQTSMVTYKSLTDGIERIHHFRKLPSYPLIVAIGMATEDVFAAHLQKRSQLLWQAGVAIFLLLWLAAIASWSLVAGRRHLMEQRQSLLQLQTLTDHAPGVIYQYLLRPDGSSCFPFASAGLRDIYRFNPEDVVDDAAGVLKIIHPDDLDNVIAAIQTSAQQLTPWVQEYRVRFADGEVHWLSGNAAPEKLADGSVLWHGFISDITARKQAAELMTTLSVAVDQSPVSIIITDLQGLIRYVNPNFERTTGYSRAEMLGKNPRILSSGEKSAEDYRDLWRTLMAGKVWEGEFHNRCKDGTLFWERAVMTPIFDNKGTILQFLAIKEDITERKRAEAQLRIAATAFETQEGMCITDAAGIILRVNQAYSVITGYKAEEVMGQSTRILNSGRHDTAFYMAMWASIRHTGAWRGEIWNRRKNGEIFPEWLSITAVKDEQNQVTHHVSTLADITHRKIAEAKIENLAFYDPLTNLPNRRLLIDRLNHSLASNARHQYHGALLFIDLDNFKNLNDTHGHDQGDLLLKQVAQRLIRCIRKGDTVARLGGDEFVVLLQNLNQTNTEAMLQADTVAQKILLTLQQSYEFNHLTHYSSASLGITLISKNDTSVDELLKRADLALYQAKNAGRNTLCFYDPEMQAQMKARTELEADLRHGLKTHQFLLYYQPQINQDGQLTGVEALIRWQHPQRGMVSPAHFIPLAESTGLILPLGQWVLETACQQLAIWAMQPTTAHLTIAVNVSALQFHRQNFLHDLLATVNRTGSPTSRLKLELTESLLVKDMEDIIAKMMALKAHGIGFSLDDFGTGYSSLSYLKRLPLDQLKIDQSFLHEALTHPKDAAIVRAIVALGHNLGMTVIAEGVETLEQRNFLFNEGCLNYQGYYFGRPGPVQELDKFLHTS